MNIITIITPTYNRKHTLSRLHDSLVQQTNFSFNWLIIDDGSTDETNTLIESFLSEKHFQIYYYIKRNEGKHTALNLAYHYLETPLAFIVDSDDYLPSDAVSTILHYYEKYKNEPNLCGFSFLRYYSNGKVNTAFFPENEKIESYIEGRINKHIGGDKAEVFYTDILKKYPFPVYDNEKFVPEDLIWIKMAQKYKMVHINKCIYISDYLNDGLTKNGRKNKIESPNGMINRSLCYINNNKVNFKTKMKMMLLYCIYSFFGNKTISEQASLVKLKFLFYISLLPGYIIFLLWNQKYKSRK